MAACKDCGQPITPTGKKGRPWTRCESCRTKNKSVEEAERIVESAVVPPAADSRTFPPPQPIPATRRVVVSSHKFVKDPHPAAYRWCARCGRSAEVHQ